MPFVRITSTPILSSSRFFDLDISGKLVYLQQYSTVTIVDINKLETDP